MIKKSYLLFVAVVSAAWHRSSKNAIARRVLGYKLEYAVYTPHYRIVEYFKYVATASNVKLQQFGAMARTAITGHVHRIRQGASAVRKDPP